MPRHANWTAPLIEYLAAAARKPFKPGHHDCALFAAGAVAAMTGTDFAAQWRGRYTTLRGGLRVIRRDGYRDQLDFVARHFAEVPMALAQVGDLAVVPSDQGPALGVVQGASIYVLGPQGLSLVRLTDAIRAYRVE